ncbi:MAG: hypothetical protein ACKO9F_15905 [Caldilinea sp.]
MYDCERAVQAWHGKQAETKGQKSDDADDGDGERSILLHGVTSPLDSVICTAFQRAFVFGVLAGILRADRASEPARQLFDVQTFSLVCICCSQPRP